MSQNLVVQDWIEDRGENLSPDAAARAGERHFFLCLALVLVGCGMLMVHSASITSYPTEFERVYLSRHLTFLAIGLPLAWIVSLLPASFWRTWAPFFFLASTALLLSVHIPGLGTRVNGSQRWIRIGSWTMQPSEIAKVTLPLMMAWQLTCPRIRRSRSFFVRLFLVWPLLCVAPLIVLQPDLGTTLFLALSMLIALFLGGWPLSYFVAATLALIPLAGTLLVLKPYQWQRITGFVQTWVDFNQAPYQLKQSLVSLGSGGLQGVGIGQGWQKLSFLPEANTDFVFAVVGEELGLVGTLGLTLLWIGFYTMGLRILRHLPQRSFAAIAGITLLSQLVMQAAINVAVVTAMVPPKGISHPFISYGGSSLVVSLVTVGLILSFAKEENPAAEIPRDSDD
ncbi:MAG: putative peptidoglycan glycosyltransferase FtsW [Planctomycetota bacterium]|nr:putative peptidoglycan glycosyltransferase FtsW [Planctomycetota bacterium]MDA1214447.1 putative peptidoglycan glycosyltransferase FtsW [Planctomycetota bacterium]